MTSNGLGIEGLVRTGQISLELMKPLHFFPYQLSKEIGQLFYQFVYSSVPIFAVYVWVLGLRLPVNPLTWLYTFAALAMAAYISLCIGYLIGLTAVWTTESRWLTYVHHGLNMLLGGFFIPVEWLPGWLETVGRWSPYPCLQYYTTRIYMELDGYAQLMKPLFWCVVFTLLCLGMTRWMRRKVEVQGG